MAVCPQCGKETNQPDAAYCLYCGSSLAQANRSGFNPGSISSMNAPGYSSSTGPSMSNPEASQRYERALGKVEQMGAVVLGLSIVALVLLFIP